MTGLIPSLRDMTLRNPTQIPEGEAVGNPLLSLQATLLDKITQYVMTGATQKQAAANAIRWRQVSIASYGATHASHIANVIDTIKHQQHLDEALIALWERAIILLWTETRHIITPEGIRKWMADPKNAPLLASIKAIDLEGRQLKVIPPEIKTLCNLRTLRLNHNQITQIDPKAFGPSLQELDLSDNKIAQIDPQAFANCSALQRLNLSNNQITKIAPQLFMGCQDLRSLTLSDNRIVQIDPATFAGYTALRRLLLSNNQIAQIASQAFLGCFTLETLYLNNNAIALLSPEAFADCKALENLYLHHNQITQIARPTFLGCSALKTLYLHYNQIAQIPPQTFADCIALKALHMNDNQIVQIASQTFMGSQTLQELHLNDNQIMEICPAAFTGCSGLQKLYLHDNRITQIDSLMLIGCPALQWLYLYNNLITEIAPETFAFCRVLKRLDLNNNKLAQVGPEAFAGCLSLRELHLSNNQIVQLSPTALVDCQALEELNLCHNQLIQIAPQTFASCHKTLRQLFLKGNSLLLYDLLPDESFTLNCLPKFQAFFEHPCKSIVATFYQALSKGPLSKEVTVKYLKQFQAYSLICEMVHEETVAAATAEAGRALETDREDHICDDRPIFYRAVKRAVREKYQRLSEDQRRAVHEIIGKIEQERVSSCLGPSAATSIDPIEYGKQSREFNVLVFIDAMAAVSGDA